MKIQATFLNDSFLPHRFRERFDDLCRVNGIRSPTVIVDVAIKDAYGWSIILRIDGTEKRHRYAAMRRSEEDAVQVIFDSWWKNATLQHVV